MLKHVIVQVYIPIGIACVCHLLCGMGCRSGEGQYRFMAKDKSTGKIIHEFSYSLTSKPFDRINWNIPEQSNNTDGSITIHSVSSLYWFPGGVPNTTHSIGRDSAERVLCAYAPDYSMACLELPPPSMFGVLEVIVELERGKGVTCGVKNEKGEPVAGASVHVGQLSALEGYEPFAKTSAPEGTFWLPDLCESALIIGVTHSDAGQVWASGKELFAHPELILRPFAALEITVSGEKLPEQIPISISSPYMQIVPLDSDAIMLPIGKAHRIENLPPGPVNLWTRLVWNGEAWTEDRAQNSPANPMEYREMVRCILFNAPLSSGTITPLAIPMETATAYVKGKISSNGNAVFRTASLLVREPSGMVFLSARTTVSDDGVFEFGPAPPGRAILGARAILDDGVMCNGSILFDLPPNAAEEQSLAIPLGEGSIEGMASGSSVEGRIIWLVSAALDAYWRDLTSSGALMDVLMSTGRTAVVKDGVYSFDHIPAGEYRLVERMNGQGPGPLSEIRTQPITVPENGAMQVKFPK